MVFKMAEEKMMSKFPFSMENFPRHQSSFACLSLKFGSVISALIAILYSVFAIAQCAAALAVIPSQEQGEFATMVLFGLVIVVTITHAVTFVFSSLMLVGVVADKAQLMRPWIIWISIQVTVCLLLFVFWSTMNMINHFADASLLTYMLEFLTQLIRFYMLMVVASYYKQLEEEKGESEKLMKIMYSDTWYNV